MSPLHHLRQIRRDTGGAALVEFTLVAPLLISLMCGLAEFGQALRQYHIMEKGVRDAGRFLSRYPADPCSSGGAATWAGAVAQAQNLAKRGSTNSSAPLLPTWTSSGSVDVDPNCMANPVDPITGQQAWHGPAQLPIITVTATAPYADIGMLQVLGFTPPTLTVTHQELKVQ